MPARIPLDTEMIASAASYAVFSAQEDNRYPPPSCSAFHGRCGSNECAVTTCGTPCSSLPMCPAMLAYQVCECSNSTLPVAATIDRSTDNVVSAAFAPDRSGAGRCPVAPGRSSPKQCTSTSMSLRSSRTRYSTWTPAPPYTSGGNSRVRIAVCTPGNLLSRTGNRPTSRPPRGPARRSTGSHARKRPGAASLCAMAKPKVLGIVLAGGEGKRLWPLTADRAKPAVPFGGNYRLVDFVLSNLVNAGYIRICVLTQYKSHSLDRHITTTWRLSSLLGQYITTVPAQQRLGRRWYTGSADAIFQSLNLVYDEEPDYIVVFGADHVYRMDPSQMLTAHIESGVGCTVAGIRVPRAEAKAFGCIGSDETGLITEFLEKPSEPPSVPDDPEVTFASMGNYIFTTDVLLEALKADAEDGDSDHDMGGDIIPRLVADGKAHVYD